MNIKFNIKSVLLGIFALMVSNASALEVGQPAPNLPLHESHFKSLSELKGKVVYLDFWASWCIPCRKSFPWMTLMQKKYPRLKIIALNVDTERALGEKFLDEIHTDLLVEYDSTNTATGLLGIRGLPSSFLIDENGNIIYIHKGFSDSTGDKLEAIIIEALKPKS